MSVPSLRASMKRVCLRRSRSRVCRRLLVLGQEPQADGNLRAVEELAGHGDHAVHEVGLDDGAADVAFAGLVGRHAAVGEDEASHAVGREVVDEVLTPRRSWRCPWAGRRTASARRRPCGTSPSR